MILPNFILAGAAKSGTSTLYNYLCQHPDIYMSETKEPFFFDFNYDKGLDYYSTFFKNYSGEKIIGEATVWYMSWPGVPERIYESLPEVKLLFILRNPIDRAYSNYMHDLRSGLYKPNQTFGYVIRNEEIDDSIHRRIVLGGYYYRHIQEFLKYFESDSILILLYDDIKSDFNNVGSKIFNFLDIQSNIYIKNYSDAMVSPYLRLTKLLPIISSFVPMFNYFWKKSHHFRRIFLKYNTNKKNIIEDEDRKFLQNIYKSDINNLEIYLNRDLSFWE